ncbi:MAG: biotin/lipoyl-binding protein [Alphaproteobacteria bacterium]|nr:biotin/lipoyl-binding protein [Alphaproteobacteria bacterium]MBT4020040.1 biotin/lipoyl-binding protein [Alphaproteobacteria bacterium]MBT5161882.1 biotin/lipoyl-binding protein [Alphaproteobacteria bacterium]MBT5917287.1 biotin/lipoyl-binding protein [Alphaproteobacteria bacterium]MBT6387586.1 biotin/lipoyl-binding protein [Alphaproteobacteria bacterium]
MRINNFTSFVGALFLMMAPTVAAHAQDQALGFALSGVVEKVLVTAGDKVSKGQAIAVLDTIRIKARMTAVLAEVAVSQKIVNLATRRFDYAREQFDAVSLSKVELDTAQITRDEALARLAKAQARQTILQWRYDHATLRAPQSGRVKLVSTWPGMVINLRHANPQIIVLTVP